MLLERMSAFSSQRLIELIIVDSYTFGAQQEKSERILYKFPNDIEKSMNSR